MLLEDSESKMAVLPAAPARGYFVSRLFSSRKKGGSANGCVAAGGGGEVVVASKSRLSVLGRLFRPWKWKRKKKSDRFERTSRTLERKISMRSTKEELIKKGVLLPDDSRRHPTTNDCVAYIPPTVSPGMEDAGKEAERSSAFLSTLDSMLASSLNHALHSHNKVSLLGLPEVEEVHPAHTIATEMVLAALPEPPISVSDIGPIPPPPAFSNPSPLLTPKFTTDLGECNNVSDPEESVDSPVMGNHRPVSPAEDCEEVIPAKEPQPLSAKPKKSALKKKGPFTCADFQRLSLLKNRSKADASGDQKRSPKVPTISISSTDNSDSDSESENQILWKDYYGEDEECRRVAKVARKDSLALKLAQRPDIQELIERNIYVAHSEQESQEVKEDVKKKLTRRLSLRPSPDELEQKNILKYQSAEELQKEKEEKKKTLIRKLSFRPTIEELKERKIIRFNDYVEVTQAQDYDRRSDKPWTRLTPRDKAAIRKELNEFKSMEMEVHEESRQFTRFHRP